MTPKRRVLLSGFRYRARRFRLGHRRKGASAIGFLQERHRSEGCQIYGVTR